MYDRFTTRSGRLRLGARRAGAWCEERAAAVTRCFARYVSRMGVGPRGEVIHVMGAGLVAVATAVIQPALAGNSVIRCCAFLGCLFLLVSSDPLT